MSLVSGSDTVTQHREMRRETPVGTYRPSSSVTRFHHDGIVLLSPPRHRRGIRDKSGHAVAPLKALRGRAFMSTTRRCPLPRACYDYFATRRAAAGGEGQIQVARRSEVEKPNNVLVGREKRERQATDRTVAERPTPETDGRRTRTVCIVCSYTARERVSRRYRATVAHMSPRLSWRV